MDAKCGLSGVSSKGMWHKFSPFARLFRYFPAAVNQPAFLWGKRHWRRWKMWASVGNWVEMRGGNESYSESGCHFYYFFFFRLPLGRESTV